MKENIINKQDYYTEPKQLTLFVNLDGFEGPIDLLLNLAREQKVDLGKIAILPLAEQYIDFIENVKKLNLEIAADYLVIAAWLVYLKSKLIIPDLDYQDHQEITEMSDALKFRIKQLEAIQKVSKKLFDLPLLGIDRLSRGNEEIFEENLKINWSCNLYVLIKSYAQLNYENDNETLTIVQSKLFSIQEATERLKGLLPKIKNWTNLKNFLPKHFNHDISYKSSLAAHFAASLELSRDGLVSIKQTSNYSPIYIKKKVNE